MKTIPLRKVQSFETAENVLVTKRIEDGRTTAFNIKERDLAERHAKKIGSYVYNLFCKATIDGKNVNTQYGYAVPN
jgi:hypothetical protein